MPIPTYPVPPSIPPLHLYRHLLRETSYLPPAFRHRIESEVRRRFRKHQYDLRRPIQKRASGRQALRTLRAANSGDKTCMGTLLMKAFARLGHHKWRMSFNFRKPEIPVDTKALAKSLAATLHSSTPPAEQAQGDKADKAGDASDNTAATSQGRNSRPRKAPFESWDKKKLMDLFKSQRHQQDATRSTASWPGSDIKHTNDDKHIPKLNIWDKPLAEIVVQTKKSKWWKRTFHKAMLPLGQSSWELLQRLSDGAQDTGPWQVPTRRPLAISPNGSPSSMEQQEDWESYGHRAADKVEAFKSFKHARRTGLQDAGPHSPRSRATENSARWYRRAYNRVWQITPKMERDPATTKYSFEWGSVRDQTPRATEDQLELLGSLSELAAGKPSKKSGRGRRR